MAFNKRAGGFMWRAKSAGRTPPWSAAVSFRETDEWLLARGWTTEDKIRWRSEHRGRVTIATYLEAQKIQRRRDRAARNGTAAEDTGKVRP